MCRQRWNGWRWLVTGLAVGGLAVGLGVVLRAQNLETAANIAQLLSLLPIVASMIGWECERRKTPDISLETDNPSGSSSQQPRQDRSPVYRHPTIFPGRRRIQKVTTGVGLLAIGLTPAVVAAHLIRPLLKSPEPRGTATGRSREPTPGPTRKISRTHRVGGPIQSDPSVADGVVYVGSDDSRVYALDAATGVERWSHKTGKEVFSAPAVVDGVGYIGSLDGKVYALDATTGQG